MQDAGMGVRAPDMDAMDHEAFTEYGTPEDLTIITKGRLP